jgi:hypothetical protein
MARLTPEEIYRIDKALEATKGNHTHAAMALGITALEVHTAVRHNPALQAKWSPTYKPPVEPTEASDLHRDTPPAVAAAKIVDAINKQDALVAKRGTKLPGFTNKEQKFFAQLMSCYAGNYKTAADFAHSGAVHAAGRLVSALEKANDRLLDIEENPDKYTRSTMGMHGENVTKTPAEFWNDTMNLIVKITGELRKMNQSVLQSNELRLRIEKLKQSQAKEVKSVPGWEPGKAVEAVVA